jgi:hypothetical protein
VHQSAGTVHHLLSFAPWLTWPLLVLAIILIKIRRSARRVVGETPWYVRIAVIGAIIAWFTRRNGGDPNVTARMDRALRDFTLQSRRDFTSQGHRDFTPTAHRNITPDTHPGAEDRRRRR